MRNVLKSDEFKYSLIAIFIGTTIMFLLWSIAITSIATDLRDVVIMKEQKIEELEYDYNSCKWGSEEIYELFTNCNETCNVEE